MVYGHVTFYVVLMVKLIKIYNIVVIPLKKYIVWNEEKFIKMFSNLSLPYDCILECLIEDEKFTYFYSSNKPFDIKRQFKTIKF